jgi:hypothetical protein
MIWSWSNWFERLVFGGQEGRRRSRKGTRQLSRPGGQLRLEPLEQRTLLSAVLPPSLPLYGNELNSNVTALVSTPAAVVERSVPAPHGAVSVLATNLTDRGGGNLGGGNVNPSIQAGGPSSENVYGGPAILLGGGDLGVIIIAPDGVHIIGPSGPQTRVGEQTATGAGLASQARRAATTNHPVDLAKAKAELAQELPAIRAAVLHGTGLTFSTQDLMISVLAAANESDCICTNISGCANCSDATDCADTPGGAPGDPWDKIINPAELSELQAVLKQAVFQNAALSGGRH